MSFRDVWDSENAAYDPEKDVPDGRSVLKWDQPSSSMASAVGGALLPPIATMPYLYKVFNPVFDAAPTPKSETLQKALYALAEKRGIDFDIRQGPQYNAAVSTITPEGQHMLFSPTGTKEGIPAPILAHEMGHVRNFKRPVTKHPGPVRLAALIGGVGGTLGAATAKTDTGGLVSALAGSGLTLPLLYDEFLASHEGRKVLIEAAKSTGQSLGLSDKLMPYVGVPTYAMGFTAPPIAAYLLKKYLFGYMKPRTKESTMDKKSYLLGLADGISKIAEGAIPASAPKRPRRPVMSGLDIAEALGTIPVTLAGTALGYAGGMSLGDNWEGGNGPVAAGVAGMIGGGVLANHTYRRIIDRIRANREHNLT